MRISPWRRRSRAMASMPASWSQSAQACAKMSAGVGGGVRKRQIGLGGRDGFPHLLSGGLFRQAASVAQMALDDLKVGVTAVQRYLARAVAGDCQQRALGGPAH